MNNPIKLNGIYCALVTPIKESEKIDERGLKKLINHVLKGGVNGILLLGSSGEFATLLDKEKKRLIEIAKEEVGNSVPIIVGTGDCGTKRATENTKVAKDLGADAVLVLPPYYYDFKDSKSIKRYYKEIISEANIPLLIYNYPALTNITISPELISDLGDEEKIIGIKNSSWDFVYFQNIIQIAKDKKNFSVMQGSDRLLFNSFLYGADGAISITANVAPELSVNLYKSIQENKLKAKSLQDKILSLIEILSKYGNYIASLKAILSLSGICHKYMTSPFDSIDDTHIEKLGKELESSKLLKG